jgi:hypothetical protein
VLPPPHQVPVSPTPGAAGQLSLLHHPHSICSVFRRGPCFPYYLPPIGQDLRLTIVSNDNDGSRTENGEVITADAHALDSIRDMFATLRACWVPPPKEEARHGMEYTIRFAFKRDGTIIAPPRMTCLSHEVPAATRDVYRDAIDAALKRCTPQHFTAGMPGAWPADRSPSALWMTEPSASNRIRDDGSAASRAERVARVGRHTAKAKQIAA